MFTAFPGPSCPLPQTLAPIQGLTLALSSRRTSEMLLAAPAEPGLQTGEGGGALRHPLPSLSCPGLALFHKSPSICSAMGWYF